MAPQIATCDECRGVGGPGLTRSIHYAGRRVWGKRARERGVRSGAAFGGSEGGREGEAGRTDGRKGRRESETKASCKCEGVMFVNSLLRAEEVPDPHLVVRGAGDQHGGAHREALDRARVRVDQLEALAGVVAPDPDVVVGLVVKKRTNERTNERVGE